MIHYILIGIGFAILIWLSYRVRSKNTFEHEGIPKSLGWINLYETLLATAIGGGLIFGLIGFGMMAGTIGFLLGIVYCGSFIVLGMLSPYIIKACDSLHTDGIINKDEPVSLVILLAKKYKYTWGILLIPYIIVYIAFLAAQYVALYRLATALEIPLSPNLLIIASALLVLIYVYFGGFKSVIATERTQIIVVGVILCLSVLAIVLKGNIDFSTFPKEYWNPVSNPKLASTFVWLTVFLIPTLLLRLDHWQRIVAAKDVKTAQKSYTFAGITLLLVFIILVLVGAVAKSNNSTNMFYLYTSQFKASDIFAGDLAYSLVFVGFLFAVISSADTVLNSGAFAAIQSLRSWSMIKTEKIWPIRIAYLVITGLAILVARWKPNIVELITEGFKVLIILLPAIGAALLNRRPSETAGLLSVLGGIITWAILYFCSSINMWAYIVGFLVALLSLLLIYKIEALLRQRKIKVDSESE